MADKAISELIAANQVTPTDLFVLEQTGTAKKLTGQTLENWLLSFADGHGGIHSISKISASGLVDTYRITLADTTTFDFLVTNGRSVNSIAKTKTNGLVDTYTISYNDGTSGTFTVTNGAKGDKGDSQYVWIKYASTKPTAASHSFGDIPDNWIGFYSGESATAPTDWTKYSWFEMKGRQGDTGNPATVASASTVYQAGESGTIIPSGSWSTSIPVVAQGKYLWTKTTIQFNTGDPVVSYSVARFGVDGAGSVSSVNNFGPDENGNVTVTADSLGALPLAGGTMTGSVNMNGQQITGLNSPTSSTEPATKGYVDGFKTNPDTFLPVRLQSYQSPKNSPLTDPNQATETGFYYINGKTNRPPFGHDVSVDYRLIVTSYGPYGGGHWLQQIATDYRCDNIFFRRCMGAEWSEWARIAMEADLDNVQGQLPVKGKDYWTDSDKAEIVQDVIDALGTPVFGTVDEDNNIILSGNLVQGSYTLKYENKDGSLTVIGTLNSSGADYPNQIPISIDTDGTIYNGTGYRTGSRCSSSGAVSDVENPSAVKAPFLTGFIPCKTGDRIVLENCYMQAYTGDSASELGALYGSSGYQLRSAFYDSAKVKISLFSWGNLYDNDAHSISHTNTPGTEFKLTEFTVIEEGAEFIRLCLATDGSPADAVVKIIR